jgi:hypothetical protein
MTWWPLKSRPATARHELRPRVLQSVTGSATGPVKTDIDVPHDPDPTLCPLYPYLSLSRLPALTDIPPPGVAPDDSQGIADALGDG